ncbi:hypothetical protein PMZ80_002787 [Knufia obscura]|uniref:Uncharacterized protein n=1 Tax=Knufia obscura TaxID=1635080 RepID=A0ABR0RYB5_9EURO|nr:hypothetical protein PMZ80_002787 [Knufia obscura]
MDITKNQFGPEAVRLLQNIADSHFISFDFEFSGIAERNRDRSGKPTVQDRYEETRASVHEYQPLQIGLTLVKLDEEKGRYVLEPYNFNISPLPLLRERQFTRKWSMSSGAISFLHKNGFDFGRQMVQGVPYLSIQEEQKAREKMTADSKRDDMVLKEDDQLLVTHIKDSILKWQAQPKEEQAEYLNIPHGQPAGIPDELNGYQRRLVHQTVQNEFPAMKTQGMGHFIQVTNPTSTQQASRQTLEAEYRERDLARAIGFRWIIDGIMGRDLSRLPDDYLLPALPATVSAADGEKPVKAFLADLNNKLRSRRKILIGHNCMTDIMFLYKMAIGDLPQSLEEFKDKIHDMFPAIIDTKFLSSCFSEKHGRLDLGSVAQELELEEGGPELYTSGEFDRYTSGAWLHEAGYDSYITAIVAIRMASKLQRGGSSRKRDHDRQQQDVAKAAAVSSSLPDFGVTDGYVTATESMDDLSEVSSAGQTNTSQPQTPKTPVTATRTAVGSPTSSSEPSRTRSFGHSKHDSIASVTSNTSTSPTSVVAVKSRPPPPPPRPRPTSISKPVDWKDESAVASLRSAFSSTTIWDKIAGSAAEMPGEQQESQSRPITPVEDVNAKMDRMVQEGKMMPRWDKEGAFWDVYGNKLQVNGTVEGVLRIVD